MNYQIREATIKDLEAILAFNHKLCVKENKEFDETINPDYSSTPRGIKGFRACIKNDDALTLIAEADGKIVGYLAGGMAKVEDYRTVESIYEIGSIWVEEEY